MNRLNVYGLYFANNKNTGFWIQRDTWVNICAKVTHIDSFKGPPPYYGNPKVTADIYELFTGIMKSSNVEISCPGNYTYRQIPAPEWSGERQEDQAEDKILLTVPYDKKELAKDIGAKWSPELKSWWISIGDDKAIEAARENGFLSNRKHKKLGKRIKWLILPLHESETDRHLIGLSG